MSAHKDSGGMEPIVSSVLQAGVVISSSLIVVGTALFFTRGYRYRALHASYHQFVAAGYTFPHTISAMEGSIRTGEGVGYIELGVLLLILTPVLRVAISIVLFLRQRSLPMACVTVGVLLVLIASFILGSR